jgi:glycosyltransferase involved in cell wall biosynthesis
MSAPAQLSASVLICTYNRSQLLRTTLDSLRHIRSSRSWEIIVVDNNSDDDTRRVVAAFAARASVPVQYRFEPCQGKSRALNSGLAGVRGAIVVFTDDDVQVTPQWLDQACDAMDRDNAIDYTGGPVRPLWDSRPPRWLDQERGDLWGTLAILDYGPEPFVFEERFRVPLGVNMAVRRSLIERIGGFHPQLGRRGRSLLGQEQAEFLARGRARGARGRYEPKMEVWHHVPGARLTKRYFRRWWYWKGVSRARVEAIHQRTELGLDLRTVPRLAAVPRYVWGEIPRALLHWGRAMAACDRRSAMRYSMLLTYTVGYIRGCWSRERLAPVLPLPAVFSGGGVSLRENERAPASP